MEIGFLTLSDGDQDPVPERCNNSIPGINVPYSGTFIPGIELLHFSGTGPWSV